MKIIAILGRKKTGKTTIMEALIREFSKQFTILAIKHISKSYFEVDKIGSDSWKFAHAGANVILPISRNKLALIVESKIIFEGINDLIKRIYTFLGKNLDLVLIEGYSELVKEQKDVIKIITVKEINELEYWLKVLEEPLLAIVCKNSELIEKVRNRCADKLILSLDNHYKLVEYLKEIIKAPF